MKSNEGALNKGAPAPAPAPSAGSAPNAPTLGPRKRDRDSDGYISDNEIPDLRLDNEAQAPAPTVGSSPKAPRLDSNNIGQGGAKVNNPTNMGR